MQIFLKCIFRSNLFWEGEIPKHNLYIFPSCDNNEMITIFFENDTGIVFADSGVLSTKLYSCSLCAPFPAHILRNLFNRLKLGFCMRINETHHKSNLRVSLAPMVDGNMIMVV